MSTKIPQTPHHQLSTIIYHLRPFFSLEYNNPSITLIIVNTPPTAAIIRINKCINGTSFLVTSTANGYISYTKNTPGNTAF
mmetsp:Transcript_25700/g.43868  ORF Transcript_25700/g.43868 Transcript_25700/m.43868 type:complete len:81 (+) Transcript_25700:109-351(+)